MAKLEIIEKEVEVKKIEKQKVGIKLELTPREANLLYMLTGVTNGNEAADLHNLLYKVCEEYDFLKALGKSDPNLTLDVWCNPYIQNYLNKPLKGD